MGNFSECLWCVASLFRLWQEWHLVTGSQIFAEVLSWSETPVELVIFLEWMSREKLVANKPFAWDPQMMNPTVESRGTSF